jgi:ubiquinone/menaquinone biosynthesis C-methylase UbiE
MVKSEIKRRLEKRESPLQVLDFGCGAGSSSIFDFREPGVKVCGVDVNPALFENRQLDEAKLCRETIEYPDNKFDILFSAFVLEHIETPESIFAELYRVMKPEGSFIAITPNGFSLIAMLGRVTPTSFHIWINKKRGLCERDTFPTHYRLNTPEKIRRHAERAGFTGIRLTLWEGRPEYFFFNKATFYLGLFWERLINRFSIFRPLRTSLFVEMTK